MRKARGNMTPRTGGASRIAIKGPRSGSIEAPMRKPLRPGKRFAAGRRVVGKSSRAAEQTGSGKGVRKRALGPVAVKVGKRVRKRAPGPVAAKVGKRVRKRVLGPVAVKVGWGTGQRSVVVSATTVVALGAPVEAESQTPYRDLGEVAMCAMRAHAAPRAGVDNRERQAAGASSVPVVVAGGASSVPVAVAAEAFTAAADVGEAGVVGRIRVKASFAPWLHQDG
jgi:hypothetical protein